jgi:hypothetical protein
MVVRARSQHYLECAATLSPRLDIAILARGGALDGLDREGGDVCSPAPIQSGGEEHFGSKGDASTLPPHSI